jgi:hypothetical protein
MGGAGGDVSSGRAAPAAAAEQCARMVFMVRPANFGFNVDTRATNTFQREAPSLVASANERALVEFDGLARQLLESGVRVCASEDLASPACPDAIFPNNWVSFHDDGTVVLYPMLAPNRRRERRLDLVAAVVERGGFRPSRLLDLTHHEVEGRFLEGTGSVVFDHVARVAYACRSPRTHDEPLADLCAELGYEPCVFGAHDAQGVPIYHTNVMLAIGSRFAVVAAEPMAAADRERVLAMLRDSGRTVECIDAAQVSSYAGNVLELRGQDGGRILAMSRSAAAAFGTAALERLQACVDRRVVASIPTIEALGGGSVRCMLAEVFLPR